MATQLPRAFRSRAFRHEALRLRARSVASRLAGLLAALALVLFVAPSSPAAESIPALVRVLASSTDTQTQLDILRGLRDATQSRPRLPMPAGWEQAEAQLVRSSNPEVRALATSLGLTFGSPTALAALRGTLVDPAAPAGQRQDALRALLSIRDGTLPPTLQRLLADPALRGAAARALATFDDPASAPALIAAYPSLAGGERRDALNTLSSRPPYARAMLAAVASGSIPSKELTAEVVRQLRNLQDAQVNESLTRVYGTIRDVPADKQAEIEKYKRIYRAGGSTPGDAIRGRTVYAKVCQQCHSLFDVGGHVGPDLTGSNRGDLDYLLQNMLDPNAVIPNEYQASTIDLKDGRVVTGIVKEQDDRSVVVATANETLRLAKTEIAEIARSQLSMMPEGLLAPLADQEFRDLVYYLGRSGQSPLLATPETSNLFFDGATLALWQGDDGTWSVAQGEIVAKTAAAAAGNRYLRSDLIAGDFRLGLAFRTHPGSAETGVGFRAEPTADGGIRGYAISVVPGAGVLLLEEGGRGTLHQARAPLPVAAADGWNSLELLVVGGRVRAALNGKAVLDFEDPSGPRRGLLALRLAGEGAVETRFKDLRLEPNPKPELGSVRP